MDSRELVRRTLDFRTTDRVARSFGGSDIYPCAAFVKTAATEWQTVGERRWERTDEWGNVWARVDPTSKGEVVKGILGRLDDIDHLPFPDVANPRCYDTVRAFRAEHAHQYILGELPGFAFNIARKLRKLDQYLVDLLMSPDCIHALHDRIDLLLETMIYNYAAVGVDGIIFCEDWGTQTQLLIDPALWRREFLPRFERLCAVARGCGITVWMHSCGQIGAIVPGLMAVGIHALQFDQPELHGIETLAAYQTCGKITFWCPVDIQKTLQAKDEERIRAQARELLDKLWRGRGGFIAGYYTDNDSIGLDPQWQDYACDEFARYGVRENFPESV